MNHSSPCSPQKQPKYLAPGARLGPGLVQWSVAGWFGSLTGCTLWIAVLAVVLAAHDVGLALGVFAHFLGAVAVGVQLYRLRGRLAPHMAMQLLCLTSLIAAVGSFLLLHRAGILAQVQIEAELPLPIWAYLGVFPLVMVVLAVFNRNKPAVNRDTERQP